MAALDVAGSINLIPLFSSSSVKQVLFMCAHRHYGQNYGLNLHTSSAITGMRGAEAGVDPPRKSPPCNWIC